MLSIARDLLQLVSYSGVKKFLTDASDLRLVPGRFPDRVSVNSQIFFNDRVTKCEFTGDIQSITYKSLVGSVRLLTIFND